MSVTREVFTVILYVKMGRLGYIYLFKNACLCTNDYCSWNWI